MQVKWLSTCLSIGISLHLAIKADVAIYSLWQERGLHGYPGNPHKARK